MDCDRCQRPIKPFEMIVASKGYPTPRHDPEHDVVRIVHEACYPPVRDGEVSWTESAENYRGPVEGY